MTDPSDSDQPASRLRRRAMRVAALLIWLMIIVAVFAIGSFPRHFVARQACTDWGEPQGLILEDVTTSVPGSRQTPGTPGSCTFTAEDGSTTLVGLDEIPTSLWYSVVSTGTIIVGGIIIIGAAGALAKRVSSASIRR